MSTIYESGEYAQKHPNWHLEHSPWKAQQILKLIERNSLAPATVCELGCGVGEILAQLQQRLPDHVRFHGTDISPHALAQAQTRANPRLTFNPDDGTAGGACPHDLVLAIDVFEHVEDYLDFIRKVRSTGRRQIFHIPLDLSVISLLRPFHLQLARSHVGHLHYFTKETALASLEHAGCKIVDWFYTSAELDLKDQARKRARFLRRLLRRVNEDRAALWLGGFSIMVLCE